MQMKCNANKREKCIILGVIQCLIIKCRAHMYSSPDRDFNGTRLRNLTLLSILVRNGCLFTNMVSIHSSICLCFINNSDGIITSSATTGFGVCLAVFPFKVEISGP